MTVPPDLAQLLLENEELYKEYNPYKGFSPYTVKYHSSPAPLGTGQEFTKTELISPTRPECEHLNEPETDHYDILIYNIWAQEYILKTTSIFTRALTIQRNLIELKGKLEELSKSLEVTESKIARKTWRWDNLSQMYEDSIARLEKVMAEGKRKESKRGRVVSMNDSTTIPLNLNSFG